MSGGLEVTDLAVDLGPRRALDGVSLAVGPGERLAVLGPSGAGKTTLLRAVAGLLAPARGVVRLGGAVATDGPRVLVPPEARGVGLVFQELALWPGVTVEETLAVAARGTRAERRDRARALAGRLGLGARLAATPDALSGGERQRVALGRALAGRPAVLLLDEPFAHLDAALRAGLVDDLAALCADARAALVVVSHDRRDALELADRLVVLEAGRVVDDGLTAEVARRPRAAVTCGLLDLGAVVEGVVVEGVGGEGGSLRTALGDLALDGAAPAAGAAARALVRPEALRLAAPGAPGAPGVVRRVARVLGPPADGWLVVVDLAGRDDLAGRAAVTVWVPAGGAPPGPGAAVVVAAVGPATPLTGPR